MRLNLRRLPGRGLLTLTLAAVALSESAIAASALPPGYVRLSEGDAVFISGTRFICTVEQQTRNLASPVVGIVCGLGTSAGPTPGSYWVALKAPNDIVVTRASGANRSSLVFATPAHQPNAYSQVQRPLTLPAPKLFDVHDIGMWCSVQQARTLLPGQLAISCWFTTDPSKSGRPGSYGFILSEKKVEILRFGSNWHVLWSHREAS
jgi:hypothetical protein